MISLDRTQTTLGLMTLSRTPTLFTGKIYVQIRKKDLKDKADNGSWRRLSDVFDKRNSLWG